MIVNTNCTFDVYKATSPEATFEAEFNTMCEAENYIKRVLSEGSAEPRIIMLYDKQADMYADVKFHYRFKSKSRIVMYIEH